MPKLVKIDSTFIDDWLKLEAGDEIPGSLNKVLLPLDYFLANASKINHCGVWLESSADVYELKHHLEKLDVIACDFETFMDGRSFSQARVLREHLEYKGEIRATGNFIQDQLHYLLRCGFNEFSVSDDANEEAMRQSMNDFSESYQAACDVPAPLFRRRA